MSTFDLWVFRLLVIDILLGAVFWVPFSFKAWVRLMSALACSCNRHFWRGPILKELWLAAIFDREPDLEKANAECEVKP